MGVILTGVVTIVMKDTGVNSAITRVPPRTVGTAVSGGRVIVLLGVAMEVTGATTVHRFAQSIVGMAIVNSLMGHVKRANRGTAEANVPNVVIMNTAVFVSLMSPLVIIAFMDGMVIIVTKRARTIARSLIVIKERANVKLVLMAFTVLTVTEFVWMCVKRAQIIQHVIRAKSDSMAKIVTCHAIQNVRNAIETASVKYVKLDSLEGTVNAKYQNAQKMIAMNV